MKNCGTYKVAPLNDRHANELLDAVDDEVAAHFERVLTLRDHLVRRLQLRQVARFRLQFISINTSKIVI